MNSPKNDSLYSWLVDHSAFTPRLHSGIGWKMDPWLVELHFISDMISFIAYTFIGVALVLGWVHLKGWRHVLPMPIHIGMVIFSLFIFFCGLSHFTGSLMFITPFYRLDGVLRAATATVSLVGALWTPIFLYYVNRLGKTLGIKRRYNLSQKIKNE